MTTRGSTRRGALALAGGALAAWTLPSVARAAGVEEIPLYAAAIPFDETDPTRTQAGTLVWRGGLLLGSPDRRFGGWSDLWVDPSAARLVAISDNGWTLDARIAFDGNLRGLSQAKLGRLTGLDGRVLEGPMADAEALVRLPDGGFAVGFERQHRILVYPPSEPPFARRPRAVALPPSVASAPRNGGIEALTRLADGRLLFLLEDVVEDGAHVGYAGGSGDWTKVHYRAAPGFVPVGACTLAGGDVVVLERAFSLFGGFGARLARVAGDAWRDGESVAGVELARLRPPMATDNYEGIATTRGPDGSQMLWLISDDNYSLLQRTLLCVFEVRAAA